MELLNKSDVTNANLLKVVILQALVDEGYLPIDQAKKFNNQYAVILADPTWYQSVYDALFPSKKKGLYYNVVKFVGKDNDSKVKDNNDGLEEESLDELQFLLIKAEKDEDYDLAKKIRDKISKMKK